MAGIRLGGVWQKTNPQGEIYYEGSLGPTILRIYSNKYKRTEKDPDCVVYISEKPKEGQRKGPPQQGPAKSGGVAFGAKAPQGPPPAKRYDPPVESDPNDVPWPEAGDEPMPF